MKVKLDENVPASLVTALDKHGHDSVTVPQQGLSGQSDEVVLQATQREGRDAIRALLQAVLTQHPLDSLKGHIVVAGDSGIRLRRP